MIGAMVTTEEFGKIPYEVTEDYDTEEGREFFEMAVEGDFGKIADPSKQEIREREKSRKKSDESNGA